jgi:uncharacterized protein YbjT (DUF2867 family)
MGLRVLVTGATGLAGAEVVRQAILDKEIESITALVRRPLKIEHPKLNTLMHRDFSDYAALSETFRNQDACIWCLGISQTQVKEAEYIRITFDYTLAAAKAMLAANPNIAFLFLSGMGADWTETSRTLFARIKGKTENELRRMPFKKLIIARPGGIVPVHRKENAAFFERMMIPFYPVAGFLFPSLMISSVVLARALLDVIKRGSGKTILGNNDLKKRLIS